MHHPDTGWTPDEYDFEFTDPYTDFQSDDVYGYGTSCTGEYRANVTMPSWEFSAAAPTFDNFTWQLSRDIEFTSNPTNFTRQMTTGAEEQVALVTVENRDYLDSVVALNTTNLPAWIDFGIRSGTNTPDSILVKSHPQNPFVYVLIKARATMSFTVTFKSDDIHFSQGEKLVLKTEHHDMRHLNATMAMIIEKAVLVLPGNTLGVDNVITYEGDIRERQARPLTIQIGNNGNARLHYTFEPKSDWLSVSVGPGSVDRCVCHSTDVNHLCGSEAYYNDWGVQNFQGCRGNDITATFYINALTLSVGTYEDSFTISFSDQDVGEVTYVVKITVLRNLLVMSENVVEMTNIQFGQSAFKLLTVHNFYYNEKLVSDFGADCEVAMQKTLNSSVLTSVDFNAFEHPWLDAFVTPSKYRYSESKTVNISVTHGANIVPWTYTGIVELQSLIYDDSNVLTPSAIQVDEITVTFEAIFGPPSAEHTYAVWDPTPNQMVSLNSISSFMNGFSGVTGTIIGNIQNSMGNFGPTLGGSNANSEEQDTLRNYTTSTDPLVFSAGEEITLYLHTVDVAQNERTSSGGTFKAQWEEDVYSVDQKDGTHTLSLGHTTSGTFSLTILSQNDRDFTWEELRLVPGTVVVQPAEVEAETSYFDTDTDGGGHVHRGREQNCDTDFEGQIRK